MKRVLFITDNLFPLGPAQRLVNAALEFSGQEIEAHIAVSSHEHSSWLNALPLTIHPLCDCPTTIEVNSVTNNPDVVADSVFSRRNLKAIFRLRKLIKQLDPDSIQAWGQSSATSTLIAATGLRGSGRRIPELIYCEMSIPFSSPIPIRQHEFLSRTRFARALVPHKVVRQTLTNKGFDRPIVISPNTIAPFLKLPLFQQRDREKCHQLLREKLQLPSSTILAGTVAPLVPRSRLKDLIWATDLLSVVRNDFHLIIIGCGSQYRTLKRFAGFTEASDRIHFVGTPDDAWEILQGLDIFWHSNLLEPLPVNLLAAMHLGIPAISVLGAGTTEIILNQQTGLGVNFGARDEFARWTKYLIEQPKSANQISEQGRLYVEQKFRG